MLKLLYCTIYNFTNSQIPSLGALHSCYIKLFPCPANDHEKKEEQLYNIKVEIESGKYVFLWTDAILVWTTKYQLGIKHNVLEENMQNTKPIQHFS